SIAGALQKSEEEFNITTPYSEFGVDSILAVEIVNKINEALKIELRSTDLFNYSTIGALCKYISERSGDSLGKLIIKPNSFRADEYTAEKSLEDRRFETDIFSSSMAQMEDRQGVLPEHGHGITNNSSVSNETKISEIAVIGMSGRFPDAENVEEFWCNLNEGRNSVREITRWDLNEYYDPNRNLPNKSYSKWGGLLEDISQFDPYFFNISPREAEMMDPQQRLLLEEAWKALEDAGYSDKALENHKCGVFVGCMPSYYDTMLRDSNISPDAFSFMGNSQSILSARIAYFLNLKGPSVTIDTACSSSLVAVHLACESIWSGTSEMALAGGVAALATPHVYVLACSAGMLSPDGQCKAFDYEANGFVPGEGVGVIVLKRLDAAIRDGDHIYGVIRGSGINQDGKTNGITAPSAPSQAALECEVYDRFEIHPEEISYIETHGTGTKLGDPIEIDALTDAFRKYIDETQYCAVGSVKTNIGHLMAASGIAGLIKLFLCLKYKRLVPSLNLKKENEYINFKDSPFYVNTKSQEWKTLRGQARQAAISSFGFSGTNAHLVVREVLEHEEKKANPPEDKWYIIALSAKTETSLKRKICDFAQWMEREGENYSIGNISYTLMIGRSHFPLRIAIVARDLKELAESARAVANGLSPENFVNYSLSCAMSKLEPSLNELGIYIMEEIKNKKILETEFKRKMLALADLYTKGHDLDWGILFNDGRYSRAPLPTYPFDKGRYWVQETAGYRHESLNDIEKNEYVKVHPLLGFNTSNFYEQKFSNRISGDEFFIQGHTFCGRKMLPGAAYLEMASAAGEFSAESKVSAIKNTVWLKAIDVTDECGEVSISLYPKDYTADFLIYTMHDNGQRTVNAQGELTYLDEDFSNENAERKDIDTIKLRCTSSVISEEYYDRLRRTGFEYQRGFNCIKELHHNEFEALAHLELPENLMEKARDCVLNPLLLDGAFQTVMSLIPGLEGQEFYIPFSLGEIEIISSLSKDCYSHVTIPEQGRRLDAAKRFNVDILDERGFVLVKVKDFIIKADKGGANSYISSENEEIKEMPY
ncbi:MAG: beta-ketoacyl synthase N-terminal-like domain-containing protein, partial [Bacillota bacterium]|nr:beta-ketoacyl synthase N-terminal-like domain-containing protein [Bacillota bacterium]